MTAATGLNARVVIIMRSIVEQKRIDGTKRSIKSTRA